MEDITEMVLNLKQVRLKKVVDSDLASEKIIISIKGKDEFRAETIEKHTTSFKVMNPDLLICRMETSVVLNIELTVSNGRGYVPAEDNKNKDTSLGAIAIDSIHTPIKNVKYAIENTRVEQKTDYEKLILEITTDGTIHPEEAVKESARIMIQHLILISDEKISFDDFSDTQHEVVDDQILHMRKLLKTPLEDLDLSVRAYNCLKTAKINSLSELVRFDMNDLLKFRNFGKKSLTEIEAMVHDKGLHFGMDLSKYKLED
jgi:DNA-directed RNA polymerase subunit alpha